MISIIRRDDVNLNLAIKDGDGNAKNITGYTVFFTVKRNQNDPDADALIAKEIIAHTNAVAGLTTVALSSTDTDIEEGDYFYDFQLVDGSGSVSSSAKDTFTVENDITIRTS